MPGSGHYDAVLLTGGRARRLGGADKAALRVGGRAMAERAAAAVADAGRLIVVGPCPVDLGREVVVTREDPPGGGPVAAIAEGVRHVRADEVVVLAVDQPFVTAGAVTSLRAGLARGDAVLPVDEAGREQMLCAAWSTAALRDALDAVGDPAGVPVRRLFEVAQSVLRLDGLGAGGGPPPWFDCDTPADLADAESEAKKVET